MGIITFRKKFGECPFCYPICALRQDDGRNAGLFCPSCETRFTESKEPILPLMSNDATPSRRTCIPLEQGRITNDGDLLCRTCLNHQSILMQLLAAYEAPSTEEREDETRIKRYREDLERRYPLCAACRARVQERLRIIEYKIRSKRLAAGRASRQSQWAQISREAGRGSLQRAWSLIDSLVVQSLFCLTYFYHYHHHYPNQGLALPGWTMTVLREILQKCPTCYLIVLPVALISISLQSKSPLRIIGVLILLMVRLAMIRLVSVDQVVVEGPFYQQPFLGLLVASFGLLWFLYSPRNPKKGLVRKRSSPFDTVSLPLQTRTTSASPTSSSASFDALPHTRIGLNYTSNGNDASSLFNTTDALNSRMATWDTALEKLDPKTPLSTRFTDLSSSSIASNNSSGRPSPFSVPRFAALKTMAPVTPSPLNAGSIRGSLFDATRSNGLEAVLEGFSLDDGHTAATTRTKEGGLHDQLVLTFGFLLARLAVNHQLALVAVLLIVAVGLRGLVWPSLPRSLKFAVNLTLLFRLAWIGLSFHSHLIADPTLLAIITIFTRLLDRLQTVEYVLDVLILLSR